MHYIKPLLAVIVLLSLSSAGNGQETLHRNVGLQDLFALAEQRNRHLNILKNDERIAKEAVVQEKQKLLPDIDASLLLSYNGDGHISNRDFSQGFAVPIPDVGNNFILEAKQAIYTGGAIKTAIQMAKTQQQVSLLNTEMERQNVRFAITGYYLELLKLQNQRQILVKNIEQTEKLIEQIRAKHTEGVALRNNVTRYELQLQGLEVSLLKLDNTKTIVTNELLEILHLPIGTTLSLKNVTEGVIDDTTNKPHDFWESVADQHAAQLKISTLETEQAVNREELVRSKKRPQVFAFAGNYLNGPVTIEIPALDKNFNYWNVGVGVKYSLSSLYKNDANEKQARWATQNALETQKLKREALFNDVAAAHIRLEETKNIYQTHLKGVELANENYRIIRNRYMNDMALTTEMLDAENTRLDAELQASNSQINILFQYYLLKKLTGTL